MKIPKHIIDNFKATPTKDKIKGIGAIGTLVGSGIASGAGYIKGKSKYSKEEHLKRLDEKIAGMEEDIDYGDYTEPWEKEEAEDSLKSIKRYRNKVKKTSEKDLKREAGREKAASSSGKAFVTGLAGTGAALLAHKNPIVMGSIGVGAGIGAVKGYRSVRKSTKKALKNNPNLSEEEKERASKGMAKVSAISGGVAGAGLGAVSGVAIKRGLKIARKLKK